MFIDYKNCTLCGSKKLIKLQSNLSEKSFYVDAIISDLCLTKKDLNKIKLYQCQICKTKLHSPWFTKDISRRIYSSIYGQHHRNWSNLINFVDKNKLPDHGNLFEILKQKIKVNNYAEYNSPFMGLFLNFFSYEYNANVNSNKLIHSSLIKYLTSRQLAGKKILLNKNRSLLLNNYLKKFKEIKQKLKNKKTINKSLFIDNSNLSWGQNDNYQSVNSKTYAQEFFDLKLLEFNPILKKNTFDLFGIFHSIDHTFEPMRILNFALDCSKFVVVFCHNQNKGVTKQHQFSITRGVLEYFKENKIYNIDITNLINKSYKSPEIYFICTKSKLNFNILRNKFLNENKKNEGFYNRN